MNRKFKNLLKIMYFILFVCAIYVYHSSSATILPSILHKQLTDDTVDINSNYVENLDESQAKETTAEIEVIPNIKYRNAKPPLYIITPTFPRPEQIPELTRLSHTLMLVPNVQWLVIEDAKVKNPHVTELLKRTGLNYEHLIAPMPEEYKNLTSKPRGVSNRNRGLEWIRANATTGVFYFADDDNTYDLQIFEEMRYTKRVSMWPVGLVTQLGVSTPIVRDGQIDGFYDGWIGSRKFPVDMAGFAVSVNFLLNRPNATMPFRVGFEEDGFLISLSPFTVEEIELLASNCTKIYTWHTQTKKNKPAKLIDLKKFNNTNIIVLTEFLV